jgi:hypothetical protein
MDIPSFLARLGAKLAGLPTHTKVLLSVATALFLTELFLRRFAPRSALYAKWTALFLALGHFWTAILLALLYFSSVFLIAVGMMIARKDLLDRRLRAEPTFWRPHEPNPLGPTAAARHQF